MVGKILIVLLIAAAVGLIGLHGLSGPLSAALEGIFPGFVGGVQRGVEQVFTPTLYTLLVRPVVEAPAWTFPLIAAALIQLFTRRRARDVG